MEAYQQEFFKKSLLNTRTGSTALQLLAEEEKIAENQNLENARLENRVQTACVKTVVEEDKMVAELNKNIAALTRLMDTESPLPPASPTQNKK
jgi:hypothetical protein